MTLDALRSDPGPTIASDEATTAAPNALPPGPEDSAVRKTRYRPRASIARRLRHILARYRGWLLPALFLVLLAKGPAMLLIQGRDLENLYRDIMRGPDFLSTASVIGRIATAAILGFAGLALLGWITARGRYLKRSTARRMTRLNVGVLLLGACVFYLGSIVLPGLTGTDANLTLPYFYSLFVVLAIWSARKLPRRPVMQVVQWSIAVLLIAGLALSIQRPELTMSYAGAEQRLSFADYRFWGLGSGPNSIAPLALVQLVLQLYQPMRRSPIWILANLVAAAAAIVVVVWAQSQTTWAVAMLVLPILFVRRALPRRIRRTQLKATTMVMLLIAIVAGAGLVGGELIASGTVTAIRDALPLEKSGIWDAGTVSAATKIGDELLTGRGQVWAVALDTWHDNPWLGYGLGAWSAEFRRFFGLPYAVHAHNQFLHALSVGGVVGLCTLLVYLGILGFFAWRTSGISRGLTLGLFSMIIVRMLTEVPLELSVVETSDAATHLLLLYLLFAHATRWQARRVESWASGDNRVKRLRRRSRRALGTAASPNPRPVLTPSMTGPVRTIPASLSIAAAATLTGAGAVTAPTDTTDTPTTVRVLE